METIIAEPEVDISELTDILDKKQIVVFNDDVNTFDHVIDNFCKILNHQPEQAHQCAMIIHTKGKCSVKVGGFEKLKPLCEALLEQQISAEIH
jgi:ATP-dependent Clp protease adaptor protein ClpS